MKYKVISGIAFLVLFIFLFTGCSRQNYATAPSRKTQEKTGSKVTPTGETVGWDDIRRMPR